MTAPRRAAIVPIRAARIAAFARRDPSHIEGADPDALSGVMAEWEEARDFWLGPRVGPGGGRMMGPGLGCLLGRPEPPPVWEPEYREGMKARTRVAGGFTEREVTAVVLLEDLESDAITWKYERDRDWRLRDRDHRERYGGSPEFEARRRAFFERYGSRRPREFWQQAVLRLREEAALTPKEIVALADAFRPWCWWWKARRDTVEIALRRTKKLAHRSMRR